MSCGRELKQGESAVSFTMPGELISRVSCDACRTVHADYDLIGTVGDDGLHCGDPVDEIDVWDDDVDWIAFKRVT